MPLEQKLTILGEAARYDASCASSGSGRQGREGGLGNAHMAGICHSWAEDGRCVSLLKVLYSNACIYDCAYCANRCSSNAPRATFEPEELASITSEFYRRNYIEGLFLSSGVIKTPDYTMERVVSAVTLLREKYRFNGYIHIKAVPGASAELIARAGLVADRLSVNIELPTRASLALLAPQKKPEAILTPMNHIYRAGHQNLEDRRKYKSAPLFAPAGQATQMIVGATPDPDLTILRLSKGLYDRYRMKRVYYSAYLPVGTHPSLPKPDTAAPLLREHRLYQADFLLRFYEFGVDEIVDEKNPSLDPELDPKCSWALRHIDLFPVEVNRADRAMLLRVPGIGQICADRIVAARRQANLRPEDMRKMGVIMKRAQYFITCGGRFCGRMRPDSQFLRDTLVERQPAEQMSLFDNAPAALPPPPETMFFPDAGRAAALPAPAAAGDHAS